LTKFKIKIPRSPRLRTLHKVFLKEGVLKKWRRTIWAKKIDAREKRLNLDDFGRFNVMYNKKRRNQNVKLHLRKLFKQRAPMCRLRYTNKKVAKKEKKPEDKKDTKSEEKKETKKGEKPKSQEKKGTKATGQEKKETKKGEKPKSQEKKEPAKAQKKEPQAKPEKKEPKPKTEKKVQAPKK